MIFFTYYTVQRHVVEVLALCYVIRVMLAYMKAGGDTEAKQANVQVTV